jgi:hypothetical protein
MNKSYTVRLRFENKRHSMVVSAISTREALTNALDRARGWYPTIGEPSEASISFHDIRAAMVERPIIDAEFPEAHTDPKTHLDYITPPPPVINAVTNDAVRVLVARRHTLEHGIATQEEEINRIERRLVAQRGDLDTVRAALTAIGADPNEPHEEEF